jgi:putative membrane protein
MMEHQMEYISLITNTIILRPYVFVFLTAFLFAASRLIGWQRTTWFLAITYSVALLCELSSTRTGFPFGWYYYTGSTIGQELYIADVPFMDSLSFPFLLYASYCMALAFILPATGAPESDLGVRIIRMDFPLATRTGWPVMLLTILFFTFVDIIIDPIALQGERWFLGRIYYYPEPGTHFGVPIANYVGWAVVGLLSLRAYLPLDRRLGQPGAAAPHVTLPVLLGCGLYYGVLIFNLAVTFWIGEVLLGTTGVFIYLPVTVLLALRLFGYLPAKS